MAPGDDGIRFLQQMGLWEVRPRRDRQCRVFLQLIASEVVLCLELQINSKEHWSVDGEVPPWEIEAPLNEPAREKVGEHNACPCSFRHLQIKGSTCFGVVVLWVISLHCYCVFHKSPVRQFPGRFTRGHQHQVDKARQLLVVASLDLAVVSFEIECVLVTQVESARLKALACTDYQLKGELEKYLAAAIRMLHLECLWVSPKVLQDCVVAGPVPIVVCLLPQHLLLAWVCVALEFQGLHHKCLQRKNSTTCQVGGCDYYHHDTTPQTSTRPWQHL